MGDLTETDNLIAMSFRVCALQVRQVCQNMCDLSLDQYRDGHAYRKDLMGDLTD